MTAPAPTSGTRHAAAGLRRVRLPGERGRVPWWVLLLSVLATAALAALAARATGPASPAEAAGVVDGQVVPLVVDADGLWAAGSGDLPAIGEQLAELRRADDGAQVLEHIDGWREGYDALLRRIVGVEVPGIARPVQRQFVTAVTLSRDALDPLEEAARSDDPTLRRALSSEALRLRTRSEQLTQTARASLVDLRGGAAGVAEPTPLPSFAELR